MTKNNEYFNSYLAKTSDGFKFGGTLEFADDIYYFTSRIYPTKKLAETALSQFVGILNLVEDFGLRTEHVKKTFPDGGGD